MKDGKVSAMPDLLNPWVGNFRYFCENFQNYHYCVPPIDKCLMLGLFNNTTLNCAVPSRSSTTSRIRELNYLWDFFLTEKADFSKLSVDSFTL